MKKIFSFMAIVMMAICMNAQTVESSKFFDNTDVTLKAGFGLLMHPECNEYTDLAHTMHPTLGVQFTKWVTPKVGFGLEGTFGAKNGVNINNGDFNGGNWFNYVTVMPQVKVNLTNVFTEYNGTPRVVEFIPTVGFGWVHGFYRSTLNEGKYTNDRNDLGTKFSVDVKVNLNKRLSLVATPYLAYNFTNERASLPEPTNPEAQLRFDSRNAWYGLEVGVSYRFGNTFTLSPYKYTQADMDELNQQVNELRSVKPTVVTKEVLKTVTETKYVGANQYVVFFEKDKATLTEVSKAVLDEILVNEVALVEGSASPDGVYDKNVKLAEARAEAVRQYLESKGVKVQKSEGVGTQYNSRVVVVTVK